MNILYYFTIVVGFIAIDDFVSARTKAYIPSLFVSELCFIVGFWPFIPKNVTALASFDVNFTTICLSLILVHMGTLMSLKKIFDQWKAVAVSVIGITGTICITMTLCKMLFGNQVVVAVTPAIIGGVVATIMMSQALAEKGLTAFIAMPVAMFILHTFFGYPIISWCLKQKESAC